MEPEAGPNRTTTTNISTNKELLQSTHRVTFSSDIEEYEDNFSDSSNDIQYKDEEAINKELSEIINRSENGPDNDSELNGFLLMSIEELYGDNNSNSNTSSSDNNNEYTTEVEVVEEINDSISMISITENDSPKNQSEMHSETPTRLDQSDGMEMKRAENRSSTATNSLKIVQRKPSNTQRVEKTCRTKSAGHQINRAGRDAATKDVENLLKLHLNVKSCCEFKYLDNNRLPRYNGFISQYGLSKDQLEHREQHRRKCIENRLRRQREIMRAKQQIADLNELAFRQWLIRKNREAKPKFKNLYDCSNTNNMNNMNSDSSTKMK